MTWKRGTGESICHIRTSGTNHHPAEIFQLFSTTRLLAFYKRFINITSIIYIALLDFHHTIKAYQRLDKCSFSVILKKFTKPLTLEISMKQSIKIITLICISIYIGALFSDNGQHRTKLTAEHSTTSPKVAPKIEQTETTVEALEADYAVAESAMRRSAGHSG